MHAYKKVHWQGKIFVDGRGSRENMGTDEGGSNLVFALHGCTVDAVYSCITAFREQEKEPRAAHSCTVHISGGILSQGDYGAASICITPLKGASLSPSLSLSRSLVQRHLCAGGATKTLPLQKAELHFFFFFTF